MMDDEDMIEETLPELPQGENEHHSNKRGTFFQAKNRRIERTKESTGLRWKKIDDGTGSGVVFVHSDGRRSRERPEGFREEYLQGIQPPRIKYYHRHRCIRCRKSTKPICLEKDHGSVAYSINICESCMITTSPTIPEGTEKIGGYGDQVWEFNHDMPMNFYKEIKRNFFDSGRKLIIQNRAAVARDGVRLEAKQRRDILRETIMCSRGEAEYGLYKDGGCVYLSWGFEKLYDEFWGHVNNNNQPDGRGWKVFSDTSMYYGDFKEGLFHHASSDGEDAMWMRPDGSRYEGSFVGGFKHGMGKQVYPDGMTYEGEFASGYEHGHGKTTTSDGTIFEGRFRFGRRDGPGVLKVPGAAPQKANFQGGQSWHENPIPKVGRLSTENEDAIVFLQADTLKELAISAIAKGMVEKRSAIPSRKVASILHEHLKPLVTEEYIKLRSHQFDANKLREAAMQYAFSGVHNEAIFSSLKMNTNMIDAIIYFCEGNINLEKIVLSGTKLDHESILLLCDHMRMWPTLKYLDLSFNPLSTEMLELLVETIIKQPTLEGLRIAGCRIDSTSAYLLGRLLEKAPHLLELDAAFNMLGARGATPIGRGLNANLTLLKLNLRQNDLGPAGGRVFADCLLIHPTLKQLNLTDNKITPEIMGIISGRLKGRLWDIYECCCVNQTRTPTFYKEGRFGLTPMYVEEEDDKV